MRTAPFRRLSVASAAALALLVVAGCSANEEDTGRDPGSETSSVSVSPRMTAPGTPDPTATGSPGTTAASPARPTSSAPASTPASPSARGTTSASPTATPTGFEPTSLGSFDQPWAGEFLPGTDYLAITERGGKLKLRNMTSGGVITVSGTPDVVAQGQGGLGDVKAAPGYNNASNKAIYLTWAQDGDDGTSGAALGRANLEISGGSARLTGLTVLWRQEPKVSGNGHYAHRIAFSSDSRHLFLTSGDRQKMTPAQDLNTTLGKVLRLNLDGIPAAGNPFASRGGRAAQIWSYGHRNPLGIAFDAQGRLWSSEMGPQGGDEINLIERGKNYGWPNASNGSHYGGRDIPDHRAGDGYEAPKVGWNPSISPGSLLIYTGSVFPQWRGDAFVGALSGEALIRVDLTGDQARKADQWPMGNRIRAVLQGPTGDLYVLEDGDNGRLLRLTPKR